MSQPSVLRGPLAVLLVFACILAGMFPAASMHSAQGYDDCPLSADAETAPGSTPVASPDLVINFPQGGNLTVSAAVSLSDAFTQIGDDITREHPGVQITFNFAGSQALATQLQHGAPVDVFAPADWTQMQTVIDAGIVRGDPQPFTRNQLAIVAPANNPAGLAHAVDLAQSDLRLVLARPDVPAGRYSLEAICAMNEAPGTYGNDFAARVQENVVSQEEDVRSVLTKVQLGEADAGIVYTSDVTGELADELVVIEIPDDVNVTATYPIAVVDPDNTLAAAFVAYVLGPEGQDTLLDNGFEPLT